MFRHSLVLLAVPAFFSVAVLVTPVFAQGAPSQADQDACTPDVFRLCQDYIPNEAPIVACLQAKRQELSPACYHVFYPADAAASEPSQPRHGRHHSKRRHKTKTPQG